VSSGFRLRDGPFGRADERARRVPRGLRASLDRRRFLGLGMAGAGALLLGSGCGDDAPVATGTGGSPSPSPGAEVGLTSLLPPRVLPEATRVRIPFGLTDSEGLLPPEDNPPRLEVRVTGPDEAQLDTIEVELHEEGLERGYYPLIVETGGAGIYTATAAVGGTEAELAFQVFPDDELTLIRPGQQLPELETPTVDDDRGVTPICTRDPACPLHDLALADALDGDRPIALLVATPAFCQVAICGPVLDVLLDQVDDFPELRFLHAEVYTDPFEETETLTDAVRELGLPFEPCLILAERTGKVTERLDMIYDRAELRQALRRLERTGQ
jgi:hypothetical protein